MPESLNSYSIGAPWAEEATASANLQGDAQSVRDSIAAEGKAVLAQFGRPYWLIGGSLEQTSWLAQFHNADHERRAPQRISFDVAIAPDRQMLTDPTSSRDLLTAQILLTCLLDPTIGITTNGSQATHLKNAIFNFIRWRNDQGLYRNADLTPDFFDTYIASLQDGGVGAILSITEKVEFLKNQIRLADPSTLVHRPNRPRYDLFAEIAGISKMTQIPGPHRKAINSVLIEVCPLITNLDEPKNNVALGNSSFERIRGAIAIWEYLWRYRSHLRHDPISFRAIDPNTSVEGITKDIVQRTKRTRTLPPAEKVCDLVAHAIEFVIINHNVITKLFSDIRSSTFSQGQTRNHEKHNRVILRQLLLPVSDNSVLAPHISQHASSVDTSSYNSLYWAVKCLFGASSMGAAGVIFSAFLARRPNQIESLKNDALSDGIGGPTIRYVTSKSSSDQKVIPAPQSVVATFNFLSEIGQRGHFPGTNWLFSAEDPIIKAPMRVRGLVHNINTFAERAGVTLDDGQRWSAYHLRHFFATVYYYKYKYSSLTAIYKFLDHVSFETTRYYMHSSKSGERIDWIESKKASARLSHAESALRDFERVRCDFIYDAVKSSLDNPDSLSGHGGNAWKRELESLAQAVNLNSAITSDGSSMPTLDEVLVAWVQDKWLEPHPEGHSFCKCGTGPADLSAAACLSEVRDQSGDVPLLHGRSVENATDLVCANCPHNVQFDYLEPEWDRRLRSAEDALTQAGDEIERAVAGERVKQIRCHIRRFFGTPAD